MPTYRTTTGGNLLRTPSGVTGEPPDGPGGMAVLADDVESRFGFNGIELAATTAVRDAIPSGRKYTGKRVRVTADGITYIWNGTGWAPWESGPSNAPGTWTNLTMGNGTAVHTQWWQNGILHGKFSINWGSTSSAGAAILVVFSGSGYSTTASADLAYAHVGHAYVRSASGTQPLACLLNNGFRFEMRAPGATGGVMGTTPYTLAANDSIAGTYAVKFP